MNRRYLLVAGGVLLLSLSAIGFSDFLSTDKWSGEAFRVEENVKPIGGEVDSQREYRFADVNGSILYGPYIVDEQPFFFYRGEVVNENLEKVENRRVKGLHYFYLKTYTDPLFYSPGEDPELERFENLEQEKILSEVCGLEYDVVPDEYFSELEENHRVTENFLEKASFNNAKELMNQNYNTTKAYSGFISNFIDLVNKDISQNKCFRSTIGDDYSMALMTNTPTRYRVDSSVMESYMTLGNNNSKALIKDLERRQQVLNLERALGLKVENRSVGEVSFNYTKSVKSPEKALEEFNFRRKEEYVSLKDSENGSWDENVSSIELNESVRDRHGFVDRTPVQYDLEPYCMERDTVPLYGWDENVYPNVMLGQRMFFQDNEAYLKDFFTSCRCPYVELTRLKWYNVDGLYQEISEDRVGEDGKVSRAERIFLENPGEESMEQLSDMYENRLKERLREGEFDENIDEMWIRSTKENSKLNNFESAYDDFYNEKHMEIWSKYFPIDRDSKFGMQRYNKFLIMESLYPMTFMTWSDSVWRIDEKPKKLSGKVGSINGTSESIGLQ